MTTIAYRDGVMAADRMAYLGRGESFHARKTKIHRMGDGALVAVSSNIVGAAFQFVRWYEEGRDPESWPKIADSERDSDFDALAVALDGSITYWHDSYLPGSIEAEFVAIGSGCDYALGAMAHGASAAEAVRIASRFDPFTVQEIDVFELHQQGAI